MSQPEALRLADAIVYATCHDDVGIVADTAAAELRRQYEEIERLKAEIAADERNLEQLTDDLAKARALNAEMLGVLNKIARVNAMDYEYQAWARAAINNNLDTDGGNDPVNAGFDPR